MRTLSVVLLFLLVVGVVVTIGVAGGLDLIRDGFNTVTGYLGL